MRRHQRQNCRGAPPPVQHLGEQPQDQAARIAELEQRLAIVEAATAVAVVTHNTGPVTTNNTTVNNVHVHVNVFDPATCVDVTPEMIKRLFEDNPALRAYAADGLLQMDTERSKPYVAELFVGLARETHKDPTKRNMYLSPTRSDQVIVHGQQSKEALALQEEVSSSTVPQRGAKAGFSRYDPSAL